ncbi:hypothetical protein RKD23_002148 [Streptomyces sp. SAI-170]
MPGPVGRLRPQLHARRQITLGHRRQHPSHLGDRVHEIVDQRVGGVDRGRPGPLAGPRLQPLGELALTAHHPPHPRQLTGQMHVPVGHLVEDGRDLRHHAVPAGHREPLAEIAVPHRHQSSQQPVQGSRVHRGGPTARLARIARFRAPRRCARLHCVPPAGVDRHCCARMLPDVPIAVRHRSSPAGEPAHQGPLPARPASHSACPDFAIKPAQCFTPAEPGHNSSAASHIVRTPSGRKTPATGIRMDGEGK